MPFRPAERRYPMNERPGVTESPATDRCPRCGGTFHCGVQDPQPCACTGLALDAALLQRLQARWQGCLCLPCLRALAEGAPIDPGARRAGPAAEGP
jgi:hypothetical protein